MATITINLDERTLKNGMAQIRLRINHGKTAAYIPTGVSIEPKYFNSGSLYDPISRKAPNVAAKRERVVEMVQAFDSWRLSVSVEELSHLTAKDIRVRVYTHTGANNKEVKEVVIERKPRKPHDAHDFVVFFEQFGEGRRTEKTRKLYTYAWNVLRAYCADRGMQTLYFDDINYQRLGDFARWLRATGKGESTRHGIESYVRAAYKEAQKMHIVDRANDPYFDYSIAPIPQKDIECLTAEQMRALVQLDLPEEYTGLQRAKDCALMSFYLCGANLLDIYSLGAFQNGNNHEVVFIRHKVERSSQRAQHIRIEPELQELLDKYQGKDMLLRFAEGSPNYETFQSKVNKQLREVSKRLGFKVTMAMVRRSWASIAASLDIPDRVIDKSLGHIDKSVKDMHYEQYDWSRTARANRAVIDAIKHAL
jgi:integrase